MRPQPDRRPVGIACREDECVLGHQPVAPLVRHLDLTPAVKGWTSRGTLVGGGDEFMIVRHHGIGIERGAGYVRGQRDKDRHPATSILPADDKPMFFMPCVNPVAGFASAGRAMRPATGDY